MQSYAGVTVDFVSVLQAVIVILIAAPDADQGDLPPARATGRPQLATSLAKGW